MTTPDITQRCPRCGTALNGGATCPSCGQPTIIVPIEGAYHSDPTVAVAPSGEIGRFKLLETIGTGGFATVYRAEDTQLGREVALKLLHAHLTVDKDFLRRFQQEARGSAQLRHPNIVRIYDASQTGDGRPYLVMELLEGTILSELLARRAPLPINETASIIFQIASALDYLHARGFIHRDLKPSNIMIDASGQATLMDFGIARSILEQSHFTMTGQQFGTPAYMAPEQATGGELGPAADIYSLGILAYEMLAGRPPFQGNTQRLLYCHVYEQPPALNEVSEVVATAVTRALAKDPAARFATASAFAAELLRALPDHTGPVNLPGGTTAVPALGTLVESETSILPAEDETAVPGQAPPAAREETVVVPTASAALPQQAPPDEETVVGPGSGAETVHETPPAARDETVVVPTTGAETVHETPPAARDETVVVPTASAAPPQQAPPDEETVVGPGSGAETVHETPPASRDETVVVPTESVAPPQQASPDGETVVRPGSGAETVHETPLATRDETVVVATTGTDTVHESQPAAREETVVVPTAGTETVYEAPPAAREETVVVPTTGTETVHEAPPAALEQTVVVPTTGTETVHESPPAAREETVVVPTANVAPAHDLETTRTGDAAPIPPTPAAPPSVAPRDIVSEPASPKGLDRRLLVAATGAAVLAVLIGALALRQFTRPSSRHRTVAAATPASAAAPAAPGGGAAPAEGISLKISAPPNGATVTNAAVVSAEETGATIKAATENDPNAAHYHYFIDRDPASVLRPGQPIPSGQPDIIHSADPNLALVDLKPGEHNVWVVLAHTDHSPYSPNIQSKVTFTIVPAAESVQTVAGSGTKGAVDGAANQSQFNNPSSVAVDSSGNLYVADTGNSRVRKITPGGSVTTVAGAGQLDGPRGVVADKSGNLFVADTGNNRIRKITADGTVTTFAGSDSPGLGAGGLTDDVGPAAKFRQPVGLAIDGAGNLLVADTGNNRIRKITPDGRVTTIAGSGDSQAGGFADGPGASARFNAPRGVAVDADGNVYVADTLNERIRKISPAGAVTTLAGSSDQGTASGGPAVARFSNPSGIAVDSNGNLFVSDNSSFRIREISRSGIAIDLAGTSREGFADGPAASAQFDFPAGVAVDGSGAVYVADSNNNRIRKILLTKLPR